MMIPLINNLVSSVNDRYTIHVNSRDSPSSGLSCLSPALFRARIFRGRKGAADSVTYKFQRGASGDVTRLQRIEAESNSRSFRRSGFIQLGQRYKRRGFVGEATVGWRTCDLNSRKRNFRRPITGNAARCKQFTESFA